MRPTRRDILKLGAAAGATLLALPVSWAQSSAWPSKPIKLIVGWPAGGNADLVGRLFANYASSQLGQQVVVENRPGGSGTIGSGAVARSVGDGYTLGLATNSDMAIAPSSMGKKLAYDPVLDFAPIGHIAHVPLVLVVNPALGVSSVKELIALAKAQPGKLNYASYGSATTSRLVAELFQQVTNTSMVHIVYKGSAPAVLDLVAGRTHVMFDTLASAYPHVQTGALKALAVTSEQRPDMAPQLQTMAEIGLPGCVMSGWVGLHAPAGTPASAVSRMHETVKAFVNAVEIRDRLGKMGLLATGMDPSQFREFIKMDIERVAKVVKSANIQFD